MTCQWSGALDCSECCRPDCPVDGMTDEEYFDYRNGIGEYDAYGTSGQYDDYDVEYGKDLTEDRYYGI